MALDTRRGRRGTSRPRGDLLASASRWPRGPVLGEQALQAAHATTWCPPGTRTTRIHPDEDCHRRPADAGDRCRVRPDAQGVDPRLEQALASRGSAAVHPSGGGRSRARGDNVVVTTPTASGKTLCYNVPVSTPSSPTRRRARCTCSRPRRSRRTSSRHSTAWRSSSTRRPGLDLGVYYDGDTPPARGGRSARGPSRAHQPRHAARRDPAAPPAVGAALRQPPLRRHRRAARVPRRVRQPRRQRDAAAAPRVPALRLRPGFICARPPSRTRASWPSG